MKETFGAFRSLGNNTYLRYKQLFVVQSIPATSINITWYQEKTYLTF